MSSLDQDSQPSAWLGMAVVHYLVAQRLYRQWQEEDRRDRSLYEQAAAETQSGILAAMIADARYNESLAQPYSVSGPPFLLPPTD